MKALFISNDPMMWTDASAVRTRMRTYAERIGELHILSRGPSGAKEISDGPLTLHPVSGPTLLALQSLSSRARSLIREHGIEVVSAQDPFEYGWAAKEAAEKTGIPLHIQVHTDFLSPWFVRDGVFRAMQVKMPFVNQTRRSLADKVLPSAAGIRVVSERVRSSLIERFGTRIKDPSVIPISIDWTVPAPVPLPPPHFAFSFITVGRLEPEKRIEDILFALGRIQQRYPSVGLYVVGEGSERERLTTLRDKLGLTEKVIFLGARRDDARGLMASAQGYIQASAYEGYGLALAEAALARVPIITTDVGIVGEVLKGFEDVLSAPPGDPLQLSVHMTRFIEDHPLRLALPMSAEHSIRNHLALHPDQPGEVAEDLAQTLKGA